MAYKVVVLPSADKSIDSIMEYLARFYTGKGATRFYAQFKKKTAKLMDNPYLASEDVDNPLYRRVVVERYLIYYQVDEKSDTAYVHRVLRASWNQKPE